MIYSNARTIIFADYFFPFRQYALGFLLIFGFIFSICAQQNISLDKENKILVVEQAQDADIYAFGKTVVIKKSAKGVFAFGGDLIIEGRIEGDAATLGGSIIQKEGAFVGGDVVVIGGTYRYEDKEPLRNAGKETIMFASYEEELRDITQNPAQLFAADLSWKFAAHRLLSALFWFVVSLALTTVAPGAVSRSAARFRLSTFKVFAVGFLALFTMTVGVVAVLGLLPNYLSAVIGLMTFVLLSLAYVFGRVALQVSTGKWLEKYFFGERKRSESSSLLFGVLFWTLLLSIPYVWTLALTVLFAASLGIVLTARSAQTWQKI